MVQKKILLLGHTDGFGGAQTAFRKLYDHLINMNHEVKLVIISDKPLKEQAFGQANILKIVKHVVSNPLDKIQKAGAIMLAYSKVKNFNPDIFICVGLSNTGIAVGKSLPKATFKLAQDFIANRPTDEKIWQDSYKFFDGIVLQAPSMLNYWQGSGSDSQKLNWLPCFPENSFDDIIRKTPIPTDNNTIKLVYFGRIAGNKGLDLLIKALADETVSKNLFLDIWGKGEDKEVLQNLVTSLKMNQRIIFKGKYPGDRDGATLLASYDALVLCSTGSEGLPLVLLESMACGVPFMATNIGAIQDCCINNPDVLLVEPNLEAITNGLKNLYLKLISHEILPVRLKKYYNDYFSHKVMGERWNLFINDPQTFINEKK